MFNVQSVGGKAYKRVNHAVPGVQLTLYIFSNPGALCLTALLQVGIPLLTSESSVSRLLNPNPVKHFCSAHAFVAIKVSPERGGFMKDHAKRALSQHNLHDVL